MHAMTEWSVRAPLLADRHALVELRRQDEMATSGASAASLAEVEAILSPALRHVAVDQSVAVDGLGRLLGWVVTYDYGGDHQSLDAFLRPGVDERVRTALLRRALTRLQQRAAADGLARVRVQITCSAQAHAFAASLLSLGFDRVRTFVRMRIDLDPDRPQRVPWPDGVQIIGFDGSESSWHALHDLLETAFCEHFGFHAEPYEAWRARADANPWPDREQWRVAVVDGQMVGVCRASGRHREHDGGHINELAVLPDYRGRGIATALLRSTFESYRQAGCAWCGLSLDVDNTTGALRLYESVGMQAVSTRHAYVLEMLLALGDVHPG